MIEMYVAGLSLESGRKNPIVILRDHDVGQVLPIMLGSLEAMTLSLLLNNERLPRPLTHDVILLCFSALHATLTHVEITAYRDGVYYAVIAISVGNRRLRIDCRPSDAIALAVRAGVPIMVSESVFEATSDETEVESPAPPLLDGANAEENPPVMPPLRTPDAATAMLRQATARHKIDMLNVALHRTGIFPLDDDPQEHEKLLDLLRSLEPVTRRRM